MNRNIHISQISKGMFDAAFHIADDAGMMIGKGLFKGSLGSREGDWNISIGKDLYTLQTIRHAEGKELSEGTSRSQVFRPYKIEKDGDPSPAGVIYMDEIKTGFLTSIGIKTMRWNGQTYTGYNVGLGKKGMVYPIFLGDDLQIAEARRPYKIENMLYKYDLYCPEERYMIPAILYILYQYTTADYTAGKIVSDYSETKIVITKDKTALSKYDPKFWMQ